MLTRRVRIVAVLCSAVILPIAVAVIYLRMAAIPACDAERPAARSSETVDFFPRHLSPRVRRLVLRAEFDHFVDPLPEIKALHCRLIRLHSIVHAGSNEQWLVFVPNVSDTFVIYRYSAQGKLLCKKYEHGI